MAAFEPGAAWGSVVLSRRAGAALLFALALLAPALEAKTRIQDLLPPHAISHDFGTGATFNGLPLGVFGFEVEQSAERTLEWYRRLWGDEAAESEFAGWRQISNVVDNVFVTAQIKEQAGITLGRLLLSDGRQVGQVAPPRTLQPGGTLLADLHAPIDRTEGRLVMYSHPGTAEAVVGWHKDFWHELGYAMSDDRMIADPAPGQMLRFVNGRKTGTVVVRPTGQGTLVLVLDAAGVNL